MYGAGAKHGLGMYGSAARHGLGEAATCDIFGGDASMGTEIFDESTGCWVSADPSVNNGTPFDTTTLMPTVVTTTVVPVTTPPAIAPVTVTTNSIPQQLPTLVVNAPGVLPATTPAPTSGWETLLLGALALWGTYVVVDNMRKGRR